MIPQSNCRISIPEKTFNIACSDPGPLSFETAAIGLHCWGGSKADLDSQAVRLASEGFRIVSFNFPEVERQAVPLNMEERLLLIDSLARRLQLKQFGLVCHSFGAEVGLEFAARYPEKVAGIFNCVGSMALSDRYLTGLAAAQTEEAFAGGGVEQLIHYLQDSGQPGTRAYGDRIAGFRNNKHWLAAYHRTALDSIAHAEAGGSLQKFLNFSGVKMYIHGAFERPDYLPDIQERRDVTTVEIPGAGHFPNADNPRAYTDAVRMFMQRIND